MGTLLEDIQNMQANVAMRKQAIRANIEELKEELRQLELAYPTRRKRTPKPKPEKKARS